MSPQMDFDVVVIGGGPAGTTAALRARELGASVALVERGRMGGTCTNDGCAPTRVLAKAARLVRDAEQFADYGLAPYQPAVDLPALMARVQATIDRLHDKKQLVENLERAGVTVFDEAGEASFQDPHMIALAGERRLHGEKFILCAGGHARQLNFPGSEFTLTHHDVWRLRELPASLAIVGGAATGCQLATIFEAFGTRVTLLDAAPSLLGGEDRHVSTALTEAFTRRGMTILTDIGGVRSVTRTTGGLRLAYGREKEVGAVEASAVLLAVGWVGNLEGLNLPAAGVAHERGYVLTDETLQTSAPHIFAAGDINGRMMLVQSAAHEARTAAENAVLGGGRSLRHQIVPHGGFTDPEYGSVGLTEREAKAAGEVVVAVTPFRDLDRAVIDDRTEGLCKLIVSRETTRLLGAHVVGEEALETVEIAAACMAGDLSIAQIAELELAYPTYAMVVGLTARRIVRELGLTPLAPEWRALRRQFGTTAEWEKPRFAPTDEG